MLPGHPFLSLEKVGGVGGAGFLQQQQQDDHFAAAPVLDLLTQPSSISLSLTACLIRIENKRLFSRLQAYFFFLK